MSGVCNLAKAVKSVTKWENFHLILLFSPNQTLELKFNSDLDVNEKYLLFGIEADLKMIFAEEGSKQLPYFVVRWKFSMLRPYSHETFWRTILR